MNILLLAHLVFGVLVLAAVVLFIWRDGTRNIVGIVLGLQVVLGALLLRVMAQAPGSIRGTTSVHLVFAVLAIAAYVAVRILARRSNATRVLLVSAAAAVILFGAALITGRLIVGPPI